MLSSVLQSPPNPTSAETLLRLRHTCAHMLTMAVQTLFPETKVTTLLRRRSAIEPWTETGFSYDFDRQTPFTPDDLTQIETEMRRIINANLPIIREAVDREQIRAEIEQLHEPYKLEILDSIPADEPITRKAHLDAGYELLYTPYIANLDLWKTSGHFDFYRENMFDQMEIETQQ